MRPVPSHDKGWWARTDEAYWQAILEQGEVAPEIVPPLEPHDIFDILELDPAGQHMGLADQAEPDPDQALDTELDWAKAQQAMDNGASFTLEVLGANRGGLLVEWHGLQGFIPASHLRDAPRQQDPRQRLTELTRHVGSSLSVRLIEVDPLQTRLVFSERAAASGPRSPASILNGILAGDVCQGTVTNLTSFGAFIDLGGVEGLVHVSEMSWDRVRHPGDLLAPGQQIQVYVLGVNAAEGRIALSLKRLRPNPWVDVESRYSPGQIIEGTVTNVVSFGAFVRIEEGLEGLIHISELAEGSFLHPRNVVREGDSVRVRVLNIDSAHQRLGLSLRQA